MGELPTPQPSRIDDPHPLRRRLLGALAALAAFGCVNQSHPTWMTLGILWGAVAVGAFTPDMRRATPTQFARVSRRIIGALLLYVAITASYYGGFGNLVVGAWALFVWVAAAIMFSPDMAEFIARPFASAFFPRYEASAPLSDYSEAQIAMMAHDYEAAARAYRDYAQIDPSDQRVRLMLAQLYHHQLGERVPAVYWYEKVLLFKQGGEIEALAFRELIELHCRHGQREPAEAALRRMAAVFPYHPYTEAARKAMAEP